MNQETFLVELKQLRCNADWHKRYYQELARKYHRCDYWLRSLLGLFALGGAVLAGVPDYRLLGAIIAGGCAFILANVMPIFKWESIVSGFKSTEEEWTRIFQGYDEIVSFNDISNRDEMLMQEFQRVKEMQKAAALNGRILPKDQLLLDKYEKEVRVFYNLGD